MTRALRLALPLLTLIACGGDDHGGSADATGPRPDGAAADPIDAAGPTVDAPGPGASPLIGLGEVELVDEGFQFLEGPHWRAADGVLLFTDIPASTIYRLAPPAAIDVFRAPSDGANGLASDVNGDLLAAEHGGRRVSRTPAAGPIAVVADAFAEARLNSPNDLVVRSDGTIYFTDPPYGISADQRELPFNGVFRVTPAGQVQLEWEGPLDSRPNGIALSPDEQTLYVADTAAGIIRAYDVAGDGSLSGERELTRAAPGADGLAVDAEGNLYAATSAGIRVFAPSGAVWGTIAVARTPANCGFGGSDGRTLYITARQGLYRVATRLPGLGW